MCLTGSHVMGNEARLAAATAGRQPDEIYKMAKTMLSLPDTPMSAYIDAEQAAERLRDGFAEYFSRYDALITHVLPIPAHKHGVTGLLLTVRTLMPLICKRATVPLNVTGLPGVALPFGKSREGLPVNVQIACKRHDEHVILHIASSCWKQCSSVKAFSSVTVTRIVLPRTPAGHFKIVAHVSAWSLTRCSTFRSWRQAITANDRRQPTQKHCRSTASELAKCLLDFRPPRFRRSGASPCNCRYSHAVTLQVS
ncbi:amidase family protein [Pantoea ananatis]